MTELSRVDKLKDINLALANASDDQITEIYNIFVKDVKCKNKKVNRRLMIEHILENMHMVTDKSINAIHDYANDNNLIDERGVYYVKAIKKITHNRVVNKEDVALDVINDILEVIGENKIEKLEDFQNIMRDELIKDECKKVIENHEKYIFTYFKKADLGYYQKARLSTYVLSVLKGMIKNLDGYDLISKNHKNKKGTTANFTTYSIETTNA
jgi:carboxylesterase type B